MANIGLAAGLSGVGRAVARELAMRDQMEMENQRSQMEQDRADRLSTIAMLQHISEAPEWDVGDTRTNALKGMFSMLVNKEMKPKEREKMVGDLIQGTRRSVALNLLGIRTQQKAPEMAEAANTMTKSMPFGLGEEAPPTTAEDIRSVVPTREQTGPLTSDEKTARAMQAKEAELRMTRAIAPEQFHNVPPGNIAYGSHGTVLQGGEKPLSVGEKKLQQMHQAYALEKGIPYESMDALQKQEAELLWQERIKPGSFWTLNTDPVSGLTRWIRKPSPSIVPRRGETTPNPEGEVVPTPASPPAGSTEPSSSAAGFSDISDPTVRSVAQAMATGRWDAVRKAKSAAISLATQELQKRGVAILGPKEHELLQGYTFIEKNIDDLEMALRRLKRSKGIVNSFRNRSEISTIVGLLSSNMARVVGNERGNMSEGDVQRSLYGLPPSDPLSPNWKNIISITDTGKDVLIHNIQRLRQIVQSRRDSMFSTSSTAYDTGGKPISSNVRTKQRSNVIPPPPPGAVIDQD